MRGLCHARGHVGASWWGTVEGCCSHPRASQCTIIQPDRLRRVTMPPQPATMVGTTTGEVTLGFAIILFLDSDAAGYCDDEALAACFVDAVGTATYPLGGVEQRRCGPWQTVGAWSSSQETTFAVSAAGAEVSTSERVRDDAEVSTARTSAQTAAAIQSLANRTQGTAGTDPDTVLFGADPLGGDRAAGSLWWVFAGGVGELAGVDLVMLGAQLRAAHAARCDAHIDVGSWLRLVNCAGRVGRDGVAAARWEGNRVLWLREVPVPA